MIPDWSYKEFEQKYGQTFIRIFYEKSKETLTAFVHSIYQKANEDLEKVKFTVGENALSIPFPNRYYSLLLSPPKGGFVNLGLPGDPFFISRNPQKQYSRGFNKTSHFVVSLPWEVVSTVTAEFPYKQVDGGLCVKMLGYGDIFTTNYVDKMYNRSFTPFLEAVTERGLYLGSAINRKYAVIKSYLPEYDYCLYRELIKVGNIKAEDKTIICHPLYNQEISDLLRRQRVIDWRVTCEKA